MSVFSTPHFTVIDERTTTEEAHFSYPMPTVTGAVKRLTEGESCKGAARLLPIIAKSHGKNTVSLLDILFLGGGALIDNFKSIDKVMEQLAGKDFADGTAKGLDAHLHSQYAKWRQLLMVLHRSATGVEKEALEEESQTVAIEDKLPWFKATYRYPLEPINYCSGQYAKGLVKQGLCYSLDNRTDWRRAKAANGRRGDVSDGSKKSELPGKVSFADSHDHFDALVRKMMSILLLFGDADITSQGFKSDGRGEIGTTIRWITLEDVYALKKAGAGLSKLSRTQSEELIDWFEEKISTACSSSARKTLACALHEHFDALEARVHSYAASASSGSKAKRASPAEPPAAPSKRQKKAAAKAAKAAPSEAAPKAGKDAKKPSADGKKKKTDTLERMDGGNPAGPPCRNFAAGTCNGKCRFSHEEKASEAGDADDESDD